MADIDTIVLLDNLQFEHLNTADIFSVNADGQAGEAVVTVPYIIPYLDLLGARVIINNNYAASAMDIHARVKATKTTGMTETTVTKTQNTEALAWTAIAGNAIIKESTEIDLTNIYSCTLHIDVAITEAGAHTGTEIIIEARKEATVEEWTVIQRFAVLSGKTAFKTDVASTAAAAQAVIAVANPTAGNLNHLGKRLFILDATPANSEIVWQTEVGADA